VTTDDQALRAAAHERPHLLALLGLAGQLAPPDDAHPCAVERFELLISPLVGVVAPRLPPDQFRAVTHELRRRCGTCLHPLNRDSTAAIEGPWRRFHAPCP